MQIFKKCYGDAQKKQKVDKTRLLRLAEFPNLICSSSFG